MDVLDDYNRSDYYTPTIAQEIYLSPCFHYFIHTRLSHTLYCETHTYGTSSTRRTLNDLRFTFVCEGEQFRIRRRDTIALAGERKKSERDQGRGHTTQHVLQRRDKNPDLVWTVWTWISISTKNQVSKWLDFKRLAKNFLALPGEKNPEKLKQSLKNSK